MSPFTNSLPLEIESVSKSGDTYQISLEDLHLRVSFAAWVALLKASHGAASLALLQAEEL